MNKYTIVHNGLHVHVLPTEVVSSPGLMTPLEGALSYSPISAEELEQALREIGINSTRQAQDREFILHTGPAGREMLRQAILQEADRMTESNIQYIDPIEPIQRDPLAEIIYQLDLMSNDNEQNV